MVAAAVQWANRIMRKIDNGNECAWFVLSNLNLHISSSNMVDSRNSNKQSHGCKDPGSKSSSTAVLKYTARGL